MKVNLIKLSAIKIKDISILSFIFLINTSFSYSQEVDPTWELSEGIGVAYSLENYTQPVATTLARISARRSAIENYSVVISGITRDENTSVVTNGRTETNQLISDKTSMISVGEWIKDISEEIFTDTNSRGFIEIRVKVKSYIKPKNNITQLTAFPVLKDQNVPIDRIKSQTAITLFANSTSSGYLNIFWRDDSQVFIISPRDVSSNQSESIIANIDYKSQSFSPGLSDGNEEIVQIYFVFSKNLIPLPKYMGEGNTSSASYIKLDDFDSQLISWKSMGLEVLDTYLIINK